MTNVALFSLSCSTLPIGVLKSCNQNVYPHFHILPFLLHYSVASCCFEILRWGKKKKKKKHLWCSISKTSKRSAAVIDLEVIRQRIVDPYISFFFFFYSMKPCWLMWASELCRTTAVTWTLSLRSEKQMVFYLWIHVNSKACSIDMKMCVLICIESSNHVWVCMCVCQCVCLSVWAYSPLKALLLLKWPQCH